MRQLILYAAALLLSTISAHAAPDNSTRLKDPGRDFRNYVEAFKRNDVFITTPDNYTPLDTRGNHDVVTSIGYGTAIGSVDWRYAIMNIGAILEDDSSRVAICFPTLPQNNNSAILGAKAIEADLRMANNDMYLDVRPLIKIVAQDDMSQYANADTAVIYEFEMFNRPFLESYPLGVGIYLKKKAHPSVLLRLMFDLYSINDKDKYIRTALDNIHFGDNPSKTYADIQAKVNNTSDFTFPTTYRTMTGILPDINDETLDEIKRVKAWCEAHGIKELPWLDDETIEALDAARAFKNKKKAEADSLLEAQISDDNKIIPWAALETKPEFPGGANAMHLWIREHLNYPKEAVEKGLSGSLFVNFVVADDGSVRNVEVDKSYSDKDMLLQKEAVRLIKSMPKWTPATYKGQAVNVKMFAPVNFKLDENGKPKTYKKSSDKQSASVQTEFKPERHQIPDMAAVSVQPKFEEKGDKLTEWIAEHIQYPADARQAKIEGRVIVEFIIDKDGSVIEPKVVKGLSDSLNAEALRLVKSLPRWTPGRVNGKAAQTRYTLPINFRLAKAK